MLKITIKDNVEQLLSEDKKCRNADLYLILKYWHKYDHLRLDLRMFDKLTSAETIRRCRQNIQNEDELYPPTDPTVRAYREKNKGRH